MMGEYEAEDGTHVDATEVLLRIAPDEKPTQSAYMNPPTFLVNSPNPFSFKINITECHEATASVLLDGKEVISQKIVNDSNYHYNLNLTLDVSVPAGLHSLTINNTQRDWFFISTLTLTNYGGSLRCYALQSPQRIMGWIAPYNYTWHNILSNYTQKNITKAQVHITQIKYDGVWTIEWWDPRQGIITSTNILKVVDGKADINVPAIIPSINHTDWSFKMWYYAGATNNNNAATSITTPLKTIQ